MTSIAYFSLVDNLVKNTLKYQKRNTEITNTYSQAYQMKKEDPFGSSCVEWLIKIIESLRIFQC